MQILSSQSFLSFLLLLTTTTTTAQKFENDQDTSSPSDYKTCRKICATFIQDEFSFLGDGNNVTPQKSYEITPPSCEEAIPILPRPDIYKSCVSGVQKGVRVACMPYCQYAFSSYDYDDLPTKDSYNPCKKESRKKAHPKNHDLMLWCRNGFDDAFDFVKDFMMLKSQSILSSKSTPERIVESVSETIISEVKDSFSNEKLLDSKVKKKETEEESNDILKPTITTTTRPNNGDQDKTDRNPILSSRYENKMIYSNIVEEDTEEFPNKRSFSRIEQMSVSDSETTKDSTDDDIVPIDHSTTKAADEETNKSDEEIDYIPMIDF